MTSFDASVTVGSEGVDLAASHSGGGGHSHATTYLPYRDKKISRERTEVVVERLSRFTPRPEYLQTPGPYPNSFNPNNRRIPFVFRTMQRFPPPPNTPSEPLDCNISLLRERPRNVIVTTEDRFLLPPSATAEVADVYDVERGIRAIEERPQSALLPPHGDARVSPSRGNKKISQEAPIPQPLTLPPERIAGGRISKAGQRDVNQFLVRKSVSPGPIYNPSFSGVEVAPFAARFSTQQRMPSPGTTSSCDGDGEGSDHSAAKKHLCRCVAHLGLSADGSPVESPDPSRALKMLSTWQTAPTAAFGRPIVPYHNPNKLLSPPPPQEVLDMLGRCRAKRKGGSSTSPSASDEGRHGKVLDGSVIMESTSGAVHEEEMPQGATEGQPEVAEEKISHAHGHHVQLRDSNTPVGSSSPIVSEEEHIADHGGMEGHNHHHLTDQGGHSTVPVSRPRSAQSSSYHSSASLHPRPHSAATATSSSSRPVTSSQRRRADIDPSGLRSPFAAAVCAGAPHVGASVLVAEMILGAQRPASADHWQGSAARASFRKQQWKEEQHPTHHHRSPKCSESSGRTHSPDPLTSHFLPESDYMQLNVMGRIAKDVKRLVSLRPSAVKKRPVPGGYSWASASVRGLSAKATSGGSGKPAL